MKNIHGESSNFVKSELKKRSLERQIKYTHLIEWREQEGVCEKRDRIYTKDPPMDLIMLCPFDFNLCTKPVAPFYLWIQESNQTEHLFRISAHKAG